jgi:hypothetical protein
MNYALLPKAEQHRLRGEYKLRLAVVFCAFLLASLVLAAAFLYPAYYLAGIKEREVAKTLESVRGKRADGGTGLSETIAKTKEEVGLLAGKPGTFEVSDFFDRMVTHAKNSGVALTNLAVDRSGAKATLRLSGVASTREALLSFKKRLEAEKFLEGVELPVSNLAQRVDIGFSITATGAF